MLITDDASSDRTAAIVKDYQNKDPRIRLFVNEKNQGAALTRNRSLGNAKGRFIAFLDSDDIWLPDKLEIQVDLAMRQKRPITFSSYKLIDENGKDLNKFVSSVKSIDYKGYLKNTIIGMSTAVIDRDIVSEEFSFVNIRTRQDTYLWITLLKRGHIAYGIDKVLAAYRVRDSSISANKVKAARRVWYLYYNLEKLGLIKSAYYFSFYIYNAIKKRI